MENYASVFFITRSKGFQSVLSLRNLFDNNLNEYGTTIEMLKRCFTFVTGCYATMPAVFGAYVSKNIVNYSELCIGCIEHQFNTAMKNAFDCISDPSIKQDTENLKKSIRRFNNSGMNENLPP